MIGMIRMNRKTFFTVIITIMLFTSRIHALELPDEIQEWHSVSEYVLPLIASKDNTNFGRCVYKSYVRESPKSYMQVILTEGSGTGTLYVPERVNDSKGVMYSPSGYDILNISGHNSIIEHHEHIPTALAVNISKDIILTLEAGSLDDNEMIELAEEFVKKLNRR